MIEIENKGYLYLLLVLPLLAGLFLYMLYWQRKKRAEFGSMSLLNRLVPNRSGTKVLLKAALVLLAVAALAIALANPVKGTRAETVKREGIDIVFAIDVSRSMLAEDVAPNRLEKAKQIAGQVINILGTDRVGIIGYAGKAYPVLPITSDFGMAKMYLQSMNTNMVSSQGNGHKRSHKAFIIVLRQPKNQ
jgi:Ca-activated chloride channel family protein